MLFCPRDEEDFLGRELPIPGIVGIAQVFHDDGTFRKVKGPGFFDLMLPGRGDRHEGRQIAIVVQKGVEFDPCLGAPERDPGKQRQAEAHRGGVQAVHWKEYFLPKHPDRPKPKRMRDFDKIIEVGDLKKKEKRISWNELAKRCFSDDADPDSRKKKAIQHYARYEELINGGWRDFQFP